MNDVASPVKATKFTPGPWRRNGSYIEGPKMALHVATVATPALGSAPATKAEADANGDLIAAAREMYDALIDARDNGLIYWEPNTTRGREQKALMLARIDAVARKAEGQR